MLMISTVESQLGGAYWSSTQWEAIILLKGTPDSHNLAVNAHCARKCSDVYAAGYTALYSAGENVY